nr:hypothetical protein [Sedimentibacter sp.]
MSDNISVKIILDDKFSSGMKKMIEQISKFKKEITYLTADLDKLSKKKIELKLNTDKFNKNIKNANSDVEGLGSAIEDLFEGNSNKKLPISNLLDDVQEQAKKVTQELNNMQSAVSKLDNDIESRGTAGASKGSKSSVKNMLSIAGNQLKEPAMGIASLYLPESYISTVGGAIEGAITGAEMGGPIGAAVGAVTAGLGNLVFSEIKQKTEKQTQRVQFGSSMIQQYLPQLAMGSINYGSKMEQTKLQLKNTPGVDNLDEMIKSLQEISLDSSLDFFEIAAKAQGMLSDESNKLSQDEVIASLKAMETEAVTFDGLISNIKEGASQLVLGPLGSGFIEGIRPALQGFAKFFGIGTEGIDDLKNDIEGFGQQIGKTLGTALSWIQETFRGLFRDVDFQDASVPDKFLMVLEELQKQADIWFNEGGGKGIIESVKNFFMNMYGTLAADSEFLNAIQDLWVTIAPNAETMRKILSKAIGIDFNTDRANVGQRHGKPSRGHHDRTEQLKAIGIDRVPYDGYRAILHEGERVLTRVQADNQTGSISINKIADTLIVREESDIDKITQNLITKLESYRLSYGGAC